jgi:hypothetical protein
MGSADPNSPSKRAIFASSSRTSARSSSGFWAIDRLTARHDLGDEYGIVGLGEEVQGSAQGLFKVMAQVPISLRFDTQYQKVYVGSGTGPPLGDGAKEVGAGCAIGLQNRGGGKTGLGKQSLG